MPVDAIRSGFPENPKGLAPDQSFRFDLVRALYATPKSMIGATVVAAAIAAVAVRLTGDTAYWYFFAAFLAVGVVRSALNIVYLRSEHSPDDLAATRRWELAALLGAWSFALNVGAIGAYTVIFQTGTETEVLINCCVIGYIAGISSRNASRPLITIGQITFTCAPFSLALLSRGDTLHVALALFIFALHASTIVIARTVFETIAARHRAQAKIERLALRDFLTDVWNRSAFLDILSERLSRLGEGGGPFGVVAIDLDRFKDINDTLGHPAGDSVLRETAQRIRSVLRPGDQIARIGGDEFLVLVNADTAEEVDKAARRIVARLAEPITLGMSRMSCGASVGYAVSPANGDTLDDLMRHADLALYAAKGAGGGQIYPYSSALSDLYDDHMALVSDLQHAFADDRLELAYQPIVDPRSGRTVCCEALLRWNHPDRGPIPPSIFVPIAEATGLIVPIGAWVLKSACAEALRWSPDVGIAINLSPIQIRQGSKLVETINAVLAETGLDPRRLELEVTESVLIENSAETLSLFKELRAAGIGVSLDDFGTGFSSLGYLHDFPFSKVKVDRKFSENLTSTRSAAVLRGIAQITRDLKMELVAEGIETEGQLQHMIDLGITAIQGYLFSKPLPADQLLRVISQPMTAVATFHSKRQPTTPTRKGKSAA